MNRIEIRDVSFTYDDPGREKYGALENISLDIGEGEFICLLGPSGCGKSTLLSLLMGLNHPTEGTITIGGKKLTKPGIDRAVVFQHYSLFPWLTAKGNVIFALKQNGHTYTKSERTELAEHYLEEVGLLSAKDKYPAELSGGMQQRVAIARALALQSDVLLMDEPFGAIDPKLRSDLQKLVKRLSRENHKTVVFVTHDIDEAIVLADRIVVMEPKHIRAIIPVTLENREDRTSDAYAALHHRLISLFYSDTEAVLGEVGDLDSETSARLKAAERQARERAVTVGEGGAFI